MIKHLETWDPKIPIHTQSEGPTSQPCRHSNVACKWINGEFSLGAKYKEKLDRFRRSCTHGGKGKSPSRSRTLTASWNMFTENTTKKQTTGLTLARKDGEK